MKKSFFIMLSAFMFMACGQGNSRNAMTAQAELADNGQSYGIENDGKKDFDRIELRGNMDVYYTQAKQPSVMVKASAEAKQRIVIRYEGSKLIVEMKRGRPYFGNNGEIKIYVTSPRLAGVAVNGSGDFIADKGVQTGNFDAAVIGSGDLKVVGLKASDVSASVTGSGDIDIERADINQFNCKVAGSGDISVDGMKAGKLTAVVAGSGDVDIDNADIDNADCKVAGSGDISIDGRVGSCHRSVAGSGTISVN